jgi:hypothetical protein
MNNEHYKEILRNAYEEDAIRATALTSVRQTVEMDKFATWVLGVRCDWLKSAANSMHGCFCCVSFGPHNRRHSVERESP